MTILERIAHFQKVWRVLLPHLPEPTTADVALWLNYGDKVVEQAIFRTGKKFAPTKVDASFDPRQAYRYATGTAKIMATEVARRVAQ